MPNENVIVAFKGTTVGRVVYGSFPTKITDATRPDSSLEEQRQANDNLLSAVAVLRNDQIHSDRDYSTALAIMRNFSTWYPNASIWTVGHSVGGSLVSLMGLTFNIPSVSFEAPPQKLAAERLGLAPPPRSTDFHIGNTADPVFMGTCNGDFSSCSVAGCAFESQCHTGKLCVYDTVQDQGWRRSITNHRINVVIPQVLEAYNSTPVREADDECVDCFNWKFDETR
ncbi:hypothetical protein A1O7_05704 [Cladophialophora yegresii CBS 114405]|uniref:Putative lipase ATG15 n=1 Tax=Cladophialophora yegresii CBS 114405 TaxID=1182544 RepID=W9WIE9_9EURO|nr:uncharacterized protein A1O7_05704 [Cladophialophora yegresii CBS 114405]EXJ58279.1 hypothetical protein A1O7_05704 [Cladophialophora yegresii CBS 114405]